MPSLTLERINAMTPHAFVGVLGGVFEHSPWVAEAAFAARPFSSIAALHEAMTQALKRAPHDGQLALLNAHPELAGKESQAGALSESSTAEQARAGLNALNRGEIEALTRWNRQYREKFGFPFIIAVRRHTKDSIFGELRRRLDSDPATEFDAALEQVFAITRLRLDDLIDPPSGRPS